MLVIIGRGVVGIVGVVVCDSCYWWRCGWAWWVLVSLVSLLFCALFLTVVVCRGGVDVCVCVVCNVCNVMYVCICVCMYVCNVCMYVCVYVCMYVM